MAQCELSLWRCKQTPKCWLGYTAFRASESDPDNHQPTTRHGLVVGHVDLGKEEEQEEA